MYESCLGIQVTDSVACGAEEYALSQFPDHVANGIHVPWVVVVFVVGEMVKFKDCRNFVIAAV